MVIYKISEGCVLRRAGNLTKLCSYCGKPIIKGLYYVVIKDLHKSKDGYFERGKKYSPNCSYIHTPCWKKLNESVEKVLKKTEIEIQKNLLQIGAERL